MFAKLCYFFRFLINRFKEQKCPEYITHCPDHDCIRLVLYFDGFYETDRRLFSDIDYWFDNSDIVYK